VRLAYTILLAEDLAAMRHFYTEVLGLPTLSEHGDWLELDAGAVLLALRPRDRSYDGSAGAGAGVQLAFRIPIDALERKEAALGAQGIQIVEPVTRNDGSGHTTLFLLDPEKNVVELFAEHEAPARSPAAEASQTTP
jgi:catechol 2,3-dioxygenase-like lactoylglutathione lyase family enzyme